VGVKERVNHPPLAPSIKDTVIELREDVSILGKSLKREWCDKPNTCGY